MPAEWIGAILAGSVTRSVIMDNRKGWVLAGLLATTSIIVAQSEDGATKSMMVNSSRAYLVARHLGRGADLGGAQLRGARLQGADLHHAELTEASLQRADLSRADLGEADLSGADLRHADLRGADLK